LRLALPPASSSAAFARSEQLKPGRAAAVKPVGCRTPRDGDSTEVAIDREKRNPRHRKACTIAAQLRVGGL